MKKVYYILIILLCNSCNTSDGYKDVEKFTTQDVKETVSLAGEVVNFDEMIMMPKYMALVDTILVIVNGNTEYVIYCFNIKSHKKLVKSITRGNGPGDLIHVQNMQFVDTCIWIFDMQQQKIQQYGKHDICFSPNPKMLNSVRLKNFSNSVFILPEQNKFIASTVQPDKKRFVLYDTESNILNEFGDFPQLNASMTSFEAIQSFVGNLIYSDGKFIFACNRTDLIEIYNFDGSLNKRLHGPDGFIPHLKQRGVEGGGIAVSDIKGQSRDGYFFPVAYGNELWVLYDGRYIDNIDPDHLLNTIIVFNLDTGIPVRLIHLDKAISRFTIDEKNNVIYAISSDPDCHIVRFDLNTY